MKYFLTILFILLTSNIYCQDLFDKNREQVHEILSEKYDYQEVNNNWESTDLFVKGNKSAIVTYNNRIADTYTIEYPMSYLQRKVSDLNSRYRRVKGETIWYTRTHIIVLYVLDDRFNISFKER